MQFERLRDLHTSADDPARREKLLDFYTRIMTRAVGAERCSIFIHDPDKDRIWLKTGTGLQEAEIVVPKEGSLVGKAVATGRTVHVTGLEREAGAHKAADAKTGFVTKSVLSVPIKHPSRGEVTGAFQLLNKQGGGEFTFDDIALAEDIAPARGNRSHLHHTADCQPERAPLQPVRPADHGGGNRVRRCGAVLAAGDFVGRHEPPV
ncbi:MAG: GAF domain-containing protein, partial [Alphaproteobacteria bacterium]|nr:GAF domain-containing protein [Alphaproteobacteria bacterium]